MVARTGQSEVAHERHQLFDRSLVDAVSFGYRIELVEYLEQQGAGLMDGADDRATFLGESLQQRNATGGRRTV